MNITMISSSSPALVRPGTHSSNIDLAEELIVLILAKCPVKSLVRFKSVSKSWQSIISDRRFSKSHHIQWSRLSRNENNRFILLGKGDVLGSRIYVVKVERGNRLGLSSMINGEPSWYFSEGIFRTESVLPYPSPFFNIPLCSCDGLILLSQKCNNQFYMLWNPSTRKHTIITAPRPHPRPWLNHNFYYDPTTDDHMILFSDNKYCYTFYSCNKGNWTDIEDFPRELVITSSRGKLGSVITNPSPSKSKGEVVCVDGCFYNINVENGEIVCFDTRDGKLHKFGQPNNVEGEVSLCAEASGRRLCLYGNMKDGDHKSWFRRWEMEKNNHGRFEKWVMDINVCVSWKLIDMENEPEEVADLYLKDENDGVCSVHTRGYVAFDRSNESRIFPYSENLYMHMHALLE